MELASPSGAIPLVDLQAQHAEVAAEVAEGFRDVMAKTAFVNGPDVGQFEQEFAAFAGVRHCVGVGNGTDALEFAVRAAGIPAGSEVIIPANTFAATAEAVARAGARPVFADVDPDYLLLDPNAAAGAAGENTSAIMPVHLFGQMAPMKELSDLATRHQVTVIEDAAQAQGAAQGGVPTGSYGQIAGMSFYPGKNLGAYGDAGAVLTSSDDLARKVRLLRDHGSEEKYVHAELGFNSRMDTLQAVVLRAKLRRLADWNERRRQAADRYQELLDGIEGVTLPRTAPGNLHVWHLYVVQVPERDRILEALSQRNVRAGIHYPVPVHLQPAFRGLGYAPGDFPVAEAAASRILSLPLFPHITPEQQATVAGALREALEG